MSETKALTLSSGRIVAVRTVPPPTGNDLINAYRVLPKKPSPAEISMALLAQLVTEDGRPVVYEEIRRMPLNDIQAMMVAGGIAKDDDAESPTSPPPPSSPDSSNSASQ